MSWIDKLNKAEVFLNLPITKSISEAEALKKLKEIRKKYNIII